MSVPLTRNSALDVLRGLAALSVAWFHFTNGNPDFLPDGALKSSGAQGWIGVEVFFVISGFIIPFALARSQYQLTDYGTFLVKRIIRLDPPYLVTIALIIALGFASSAAPGFRGAAFHVTLPQLLLHLGYLNVAFGYPWLNPVFWTLAVELQYYLLVGLLFPLLAHPVAAVRWTTMAILAAAAFVIPGAQFLCHWLGLFLLGICTFQYRGGLLDLRGYVAGLVCLGAVAFWLYGPLIATVCLAAVGIIAFVEISHTNPLVFLGHISYSLYLLHVPIGGRIINLSLRFSLGMAAKFMVLCLAVVVSVLAAWALHRLVEFPAQRWSAAIGYKKGRVAPSGFAPRQG